MPHFSHAFFIERPLERVFAVATTARYWPDWHPATLGVGGDVDHPARLGDTIVERVNIGGREGEGTWTVVEADPPHRLALAATTGLGRLRIVYTLTQDAGRTRFQRDLSYEGGPPPLAALMEQQSAEGVRRLKALLEREIPA